MQLSVEGKTILEGIGRYSHEVPQDELENRAWRKAIWAKCHTDSAAQAEEMRKCKEDVLYWINGYVWQNNPDMFGCEVGPFITFPFQDSAVKRILTNIINRKDTVIQKSRKMGFSWLILIILFWLFLFYRNKQFIVMSRSEKAVDGPSQNALFWKIDFMHTKLPPWMQVKKYDKLRSNMFIGNENDSSIDGEASTGRAGVGGRTPVMMIDEAGQIREMREVWHRTSDTAPCRIVISTHTDPTNQFADLCNPNDPSLDLITAHWTEHPWYVGGLYKYQDGKLDVIDKTYSFPPKFEFNQTGAPTGGPCPGVRSPWYDGECARKKSERAVAMDLDIDPQGAMDQFFNALEIKKLMSLCIDPYWEGDLRYEADTGQPIELVYRKGGPLKLWCKLKDGKPLPGKYFMGGDLSAGTGQTNSCLNIINEMGEKVASYNNSNIEPKPLASFAAALGRIFSSVSTQPAMFAWEMQGPGVVFGLTMMELNYGNVFYRINEMEEFPRERSDKPGWYPTVNSKRLILEEYRAALYNRQFTNRDEGSLAECLQFRYNSSGMGVEHAGEKSKDPSGAKSNHGDNVIADALAWMVGKNAFHEVKKKVQEEVPILSLRWRQMFHERRNREREFG